MGGLSPGYRSYYERVLAEAERVNRRYGRRIVHVRANVNDVSEYYRLADVCVAASVAEEGFGLTIAGCLGYDKPVIASDLFRKIGTVSEWYAYIFPRGDHRELARLILHVYENPGEALELATVGLSVVREYTWRRVAECFAEIVKELLR